MQGNESTLRELCSHVHDILIVIAEHIDPEDESRFMNLVEEFTRWVWYCCAGARLSDCLGQLTSEHICNPP